MFFFADVTRNCHAVTILTVPRLKFEVSLIFVCNIFGWREAGLQSKVSCYGEILFGALLTLWWVKIIRNLLINRLFNRACAIMQGDVHHNEEIIKESKMNNHDMDILCMSFGEQ